MGFTSEDMAAVNKAHRQEYARAYRQQLADGQAQESRHNPNPPSNQLDPALDTAPPTTSETTWLDDYCRSQERHIDRLQTALAQIEDVLIRVRGPRPAQPAEPLEGPTNLIETMINNVQQMNTLIAVLEEQAHELRKIL